MHSASRPPPLVQTACISEGCPVGLKPGPVSSEWAALRAGMQRGALTLARALSGPGMRARSGRDE